jgi:hypothetical protein
VGYLSSFLLDRIAWEWNTGTGKQQQDMYSTGAVLILPSQKWAVVQE